MIQMRLDEKLSLSYVIDRSEFFGIGTNLFSVTSYLFKLMNFIQNNDQYFNEILQNLNTPFGFEPKIRLKLIHGYDSFIDSNSDNSSSEDFSTLPFALSEELFIEFEQSVIGNGTGNQEQIIKEFEHINNKSVYDAFNEALNITRPYFQIGGTPYQWSKLAICKKKYEISFRSVTDIFKKAYQRVIVWGSYVCGVINEDEAFRSPETNTTLD